MEYLLDLVFVLLLWEQYNLHLFAIQVNFKFAYLTCYSIKSKTNCFDLLFSSMYFTRTFDLTNFELSYEMCYTLLYPY